MAQPAKPASPKRPEANGKSSSMRIDPDLVRELAELLTENALTEIEVADGERRIKVSRLSGTEARPAQPIAAPPAAAPEAAPSVEEISGETIKSPMVGTAFLSPEPTADPFVAVGDTVKAGDTLLIVEAMKVMNPITAPAGGVVKKVLVADAQPVEFDQPLVIIG
jgi:acetyl-CoA carboxylase biotin carboxyl carrier protein